MAKLTNEQHREAGRSHFEYFRELLERDGDNANVRLHADHMRSILAASSHTEMSRSK